MKTIIISILVILLGSCTNPFFKKEIRFCDEGSSILKDSYFPIDTNRTWEYDIEYTSLFLKDVDEDEIDDLDKTFEIKIASPSEVFSEVKGKLTYYKAYPIQINGFQNNYHYVMDCEKGQTLIEVYNPFEKKILATQPLFDNSNDTSYWDGISRLKHVKVGEKTFRTNKGRIVTIEIESHIFREGIIAPDRKKINPKLISWKKSVSYFSKGIGLFRREIYNDDGELLEIQMLRPYKLTNEASPIQP